MQAVRSSIARRLVVGQSRGMATRSGAREDLLLEKDPALSKYHSVKDTVSAIKRFGDVLVILVAAGAVFEIGWKVQERNAARAEESKSAVASQSAE
ncbi:succinate dehydrogenase subunit 7A, mitochondrial [Physcomitrium patens]|uniref:Uncharacterized protein n=1 Tax=Physcomitrium patens TaxID=3218 RepID=A0A2K1KAR8_PHYPA|nr:uncharacterized protein LOC112284870 [Physcomitrium patens]PNR50872.1 hypothetical protein PHYPA_010058 [Physcomitrium patens]|eukprot:XP_024380968.1 uncharacterized protein LOC112284870 [Physcomitrella patens]